MMYLPYFGQELESKKKVVGTLADVCYILEFNWSGIILSILSIYFS